MSRTRKINRMFLCLLMLYVAGIFSLSFLNAYMPLPYYVLDMAGEILILLPGLGYFLITRENPKKLIMHKPIKAGNIALIVLIAYLSMPLMTFLNYLSMQVSQNYVADMMMEMFGRPFAYNLLVIAIIPCIVEEFVFRGIFFHGYRENGFLKAALASGVVFGLAHMNLNQFSYAVVLGILFAFMIEATGSIYASILFHFVINAHSLVLSTLSYGILYRYEQFGNLIAESEAAMEPLTLEPQLMVILALMGILVVAGATFLCFMAFMALAKRCGRWEHMKECCKWKGKASGGRVVDIPFVLGVLVCGAFIWYNW